MGPVKGQGINLRSENSLSKPKKDGFHLKIYLCVFSWITLINLYFSLLGKQLVAGKLDGKLVQYKPDLSEAKNMIPPDPNYSALSVLWISTYQFLASFLDKSNPDSRPGLFLVQGSKGGPTTFVNYDDICYR